MLSYDLTRRVGTESSAVYSLSEVGIFPKHDGKSPERLVFFHRPARRMAPSTPVAHSSCLPRISTLLARAPFGHPEELLRHDSNASTQGFKPVIEILVREMIQESKARSSRQTPESEGGGVVDRADSCADDADRGDSTAATPVKESRGHRARAEASRAPATVQRSASAENPVQASPTPRRAGDGTFAVSPTRGDGPGSTSCERKRRCRTR